MQGNGRDIPEIAGQSVQDLAVAPLEPPSSASLWGDMFGMGGFFKMITDPSLGAHAHAMMQAIIDSSAASHRIEAKLDLLLKERGHDVQQFNSVAKLSIELGANGDRGLAAASQPVDDGTKSAMGGDRAPLGASGATITGR